MKWIALLFIILISFFVGTNMVFRSLNTSMQIWDSSAHINLMMLYQGALKDFNFSYIATNGFYPPIVHIIGGLFFWVYPSLQTPFLVSFLFYILLITSLYFLTLKIYGGNKYFAFLVIAVLTFLPQIYREIRLFQLDLPLTAFITTALLFLHLSKGLVIKKYSILFFLFCVLAQLTKWYAGVFLIVPFLGEVIHYKDMIRFHRKLFIKNLVFGSLILLIGAGWWYILNFESILNIFGIYSKGDLSDPQNPFSIANVVNYYELISVYQLFYFNFVIAIISLIYLLLRKTKQGLYFLLAILVPYVIFTLITNKDVRYLMPLTIYFALLIGLGLRLIHKSKPFFGTLLGLGYFGLTIFTYLFLSFNQLSDLPKNMSFLQYFISGPVTKYNWSLKNPDEMAYRTDYKMTETFSKIEKLEERKPGKLKILFGIDYNYYNKLQFETLNIYHQKYHQVDLVSEQTELKDLENYDIILTALTPSSADLRHFTKMKEVNIYLWSDQNTNFKHIDKVTLPINEEVFLFIKRESFNEYW